MSDTPFSNPVEPTSFSKEEPLPPSSATLTPSSGEALLLQKLQEEKEELFNSKDKKADAIPKSVIVVNILLLIAILSGSYWFFQKIYGRTKFPTWIEEYYQGNQLIRKNAIYKMIKLEYAPAAPILLMATTEEFSDIRVIANWGLSRLNWTTESCLPLLLKATRDPRSFVRERAYRALEKLPEKTDAMLPALRDALSDKEASVRIYAVQSLRFFKEQRALLVPKILDLLLYEPEPAVRQSASWTLVELHSTQKDLAPSFLLGLLEDDQTTRSYLINAIHYLECTTEEKLQAFQKASQSTIKENLFWKRADLLEIQMPLHQIATILQESLQMEEPRIHKRSLKTLENLFPISEPIPSEALAQTLVPFLSSSDEEIYSLTLSILRHLNQNATVVLPQIIGSLKNRKKILKEEAIQTLLHIGQGSPREVPALIPLLQHQSEDIRKQAVLALGNITTPESLSALQQLLTQENNAFLLLEILRALKKVGNPQLLQQILPYLSHPHFLVRLEAFSILEGFDPQGEQILLSLEPLLKDRDLEIRHKVCYFLMQTQKKEAATILLGSLSYFQEATCLDILSFFERIHFVEAIPKLYILSQRHRNPKIISAASRVIKSLQKQ